jgi:acyl-coenzyme A thioesterase PaaI-like protein
MPQVRPLTFVGSGPDPLFAIGDIAQVDDRVTATMTTGPWCAGPDGRPAVGALGVLVDNVLGYAIMASLPPDTWSISTEIWIDVLAPLPADGTVLTGEAVTRQAGSFSTGRVMDEAGRLVAVCRQRGRRVEQGPDPHRPIPAPHISVGRDGRGLGDLLGLRAAATGYALTMTTALTNPRDMLHGGVSLAASELVATSSRMEQGSALPTSSLHIMHTRGVPPGATVEFRATTRHAGRSLWLTDVEGEVDGKVCTTARVTAQA